ncbi:MAG TPA: polyprenyl synthetase family protein, partial [Thermoanaerobaculia bacterium]|nr:polyprenyl synthetase family protein [Thermoanaerobaculia bacterium]
LSDLKEGKLTLPLIAVRDRAPRERWREVEWVLADREFRRVGSERILELVRSCGGLEETEELARRFAAEACEALAHFPVGPAREALELAPEFVLARRS